MTETVVHVTTIEQWKSVLDVWFAQMKQDKTWKIDFYGEGEHWSSENLTLEQAKRRADNCPAEYWCSIVPMEQYMDY
ncbi:hypothetical protein [Leuconostoc citreum]|uniref:hypothetical protein n=1 Tax=Leuconostoc citreum TaxID=33964 RepID=UPI0032DE3B3E